MKKSEYSKFDFARNYVPEQGTPIVDESIEVHDSTAKDSLLSLVYKEDSRTGLPTGDLHYLVSDKANPQVKQFILDNLMSDVSMAANKSSIKGMSDELLLEFSRHSGESIDDYAKRLNTEIERSKWLMSKQRADVSSSSASPAVPT